MNCTIARSHFTEMARGRCPNELASEFESHFAGCERCRSAYAKEQALDAALQKLPRPEIPDGLARSLAATWPEERSESAHRQRPRWRVFAPLAFAALLAAFALFALGVRSDAANALVSEAVDDHLRRLYAEQPLEIASGGVHQVKPWFTGKLDFAPVVAFGGDDDFPLRGGSIAVVNGHKAAAFEFGRRLHVVTLLVFRAEGSTFPVPTSAMGDTRAAVASQRGFHAVLWRSGDLGYALVSDVDERDLLLLGSRIASNDARSR